jgi:hypothetical protein
VPTLSEGLLTACSAAGAVLVRDMAQCSLIDASRHELVADIGILSFGRGKPTSVLSGGALILNKNAVDLARAIADGPEARFSPFLGGLRALAYDIAIQPFTYGLVRRMPGLHLGESRLVITSKARRLPDGFLSLVASQTARGATRADIRRCTARTIDLI